MEPRPVEPRPARRLPFAFARNCIVCEEHCPIPDKAICFRDAPVTNQVGEAVIVRQPYIVPERCTGCGICENVCPFKDQPAVRVTSANESRHPANQPILPVTDDTPYPGT